MCNNNGNPDLACDKGWSNVCIESHRSYFSKDNIFLSPKIGFVLANRGDPDKIPHYVPFPDEMQPYTAFHLGLHCLPKYPFTSFWS